MRVHSAHRRALPLVALIVLLTAGCVNWRALRVYEPERFGMDRVSEDLYVERGMTREARRAIAETAARARTRVAGFFGGQAARPAILACATDACFQSFGGGRARGVSFGSSRVLLAPRGLTEPLMAHELCHAELHERIGATAIQRLPRWFDEGLAVVVSDEPTHSDAQWRRIQAHGHPYPRLDELGSRAAWNDATRRYGDTNDPTDPRAEFHVVYTTSGHAMRRWYAIADSPGLSRLIEELKARPSSPRSSRSPPVPQARMGTAWRLRSISQVA